MQNTGFFIHGHNFGGIFSRDKTKRTSTYANAATAADPYLSEVALYFNHYTLKELSYRELYIYYFGINERMTFNDL